MKVDYLNIGDPIPFGFKTPPALVEVVARAMTDGANNYVPSPGIAPAREAVAREWTGRGFPVDPDRVLITAGHLGRHRAGADGPGQPGRRRAGADADLSTVHGGAGQDWRRRRVLPDGPCARLAARRRAPGEPDHDPPGRSCSSTPTTRPARSTRRACAGSCCRSPIATGWSSWPTRCTATSPTTARCRRSAASIPTARSSRSRASRRRTWRRAGEPGGSPSGRSPRLDDLLAAMKKLADGRLCSNGPTQQAIAPALLGDRSHQMTFRAALRERAELTTRRSTQFPGSRASRRRRRSTPCRKSRLPPGRTDEQYIVGLLRATGVLCVYGSGFGTRPEDGFFRVVFLASPQDLRRIYARIAEFTREFLRFVNLARSGGSTRPGVSPRSTRWPRSRRPGRSSPA